MNKFSSFKNRKNGTPTPPERAPAPAPAAAPAPEQPPTNPPPDPTPDAPKTEAFDPKPTATVEPQNSVTSEAPAPVRPGPPQPPSLQQPPSQPFQVSVGDCDGCPLQGSCKVEGPSDCAKALLAAGYHPIDEQAPAPPVIAQVSVGNLDPEPIYPDENPSQAIGSQPVTTAGPSPEPIIPQSTALTAPQRGETGVAAPVRGGALLRVDPSWGFPEEDADSKPFAGMCDPAVDKAMGVSIARRGADYHYGKEGEKRQAAGSPRGWIYDSITSQSKERVNMVLLNERLCRSYRKKLKPGMDPEPAYCFSDDGLTRSGGASDLNHLGIVENQSCAVCDYAKWRRNSAGKKLPPHCDEVIGMLCFDIDEMLPFTIRLHGINLSDWRKDRAELKVKALKYGFQLDLGLPAKYIHLCCAFTIWTVPEGIAFLYQYGEWRAIDPKLAPMLVDNYNGMKQAFYDTDFAFSVVEDVILDDSDLDDGSDYQGAPPPQPPPQQYGGQQPAPNYPPGYQDGQFNRGGGGGR